MGLFDFFSRNRPTPPNGQSEIPKEVFIDESEPSGNNHTSSNGDAKGIEAIYAFLLTDYEPKGYNDALINPDDSNKNNGIKSIKAKLKVIMDRETTFYKKRIEDLDFHIQSRSNAGLIDIVNQLHTEKEKATKDIAKISEIESQMIDGSGLFEGVILSYENGFMRGLSALTQSAILNKKY